MMSIESKTLLSVKILRIFDLDGDHFEQSAEFSIITLPKTHYVCILWNTLQISCL